MSKNQATDKIANQTDSRTTRRINVTGIAPNDCRKLFIECMSKSGFIGFIKHKDKENNQTYYTFYYEN